MEREVNGDATYFADFAYWRRIFGILAGAVAMCFRKGSRWHALAGQVFVVAMLTMSACGATLAVMRQETPNILAER